MGKKTGADTRAKKRVDAIAEQLVRDTVERIDHEHLESKPDAELFILDTATTRSSHKGSHKRNTIASKLGKSHTSKKHRISEKDQRLIRKLMKRHDNVTEKVVALATTGRLRMNPTLKSHPSNEGLVNNTTAFATARKIRWKKGSIQPTFNLWDDTEYYRHSAETKEVHMKEVPVLTGTAASAGTAPILLTSIPTVRLRKDLQQSVIRPSVTMATSNLIASTSCNAETNTTSKTVQKQGNERPIVKVDVAEAGQSYRPDQEQHQDMIGEALAIEIRREEMIQYNKMPLAKGLSDETKALLKTDSDDDDSDDEEDENSDCDENQSHVNTAVKKKDKLTRTQRNKKKRLRAEQAKVQERKRMKRLLVAVDDAKKVTKDLKRQEAVQTAKHEEIKKLKEMKKSKPLGTHIFQEASQRDPVHAPSLPVALTEEIKNDGSGALRSLKPKGSLVVDRVESYISRKMLSSKTRERRTVVQGKRKKYKASKDLEYLLM